MFDNHKYLLPAMLALMLVVVSCQSEVPTEDIIVKPLKDSAEHEFDIHNSAVDCGDLMDHEASEDRR